MQVSIRSALEKILVPTSNRKASRKRRSRGESLEKREMLTTFFVDDNAAPGGDGTIASPFHTIQLGIDAAGAAAGDDTVRIFPGTYDETLTVNDTSGKLILFGASGNRNDVLVQNSTASNSQINSINITGSLDVSIQGMTFEAGDQNGRDGYRGIWYHDSATNVDGRGGLFVQNVAIRGHQASGIVFERGGDLSITDTISTNNNNGVYISSATDVVLADFDSWENFADGIQYHFGNSLTVIDSKLDDNLSDGAFLRNVAKVDVLNSSFNRNSGTGVYVHSGNQEFSATAIQVAENTGSGIWVQNSFTDFEISGGQILGNNQFGVFLDYVDSVSIDHALVLDNNYGNTNSAGEGGGIHLRSNSGGATFSLTNSSIRNNVSGGNAGGVYVGGVINTTIEDVEITGNKTYNTGDGGGLFLETRGTTNFIRRTTIADNQAQDGGGVAFTRLGTSPRSVLVLEDTTIDGNEGRGQGGGVYLRGQQLTLDRSTISNNSTVDASGGIGGGLSLQGETLIRNSTISGNFTNNNGGGIAVTDDPVGPFNVNFRYVTLTNNRSNAIGGGVYRVGGNNRVNTATSIIAENTAADGAPNYFGEMASADGNLIGDGSQIIWLTDMNGDLVGTSQSPIDPLLGDLADNGGFTQTHALLPGSPAIDGTGTTNFVFTEDQRGVARPQGSGRDIGAFELVPDGNTPPVAVNDTYDVGKNDFIRVEDPEGFLENDYDVDGDPLTITITDWVDYGVLDPMGGGRFFYRPNTNFVGTDSFTYQIDDGKGGIDTATVTINVLELNTPPVANGQPLSVEEDHPVAGTVTGNDDDNDQLTFELVDGPQRASSFNLNSDGSFTYEPITDFNGSDQFTFRAFDGEDYSEVAQVSIQVTPVNDGPVAVDDNYQAVEDMPLVVELPTAMAIVDQAHEDSPTRTYFDANSNNLQQEVVAGEAGTLQSIDLYVNSTSQAGELLRGFVSEGSPWQTGTPQLDFSYMVRAEDVGNWVTIDLTQATSQIDLEAGESFTIGTSAAETGDVQLLGTNTGNVNSTTYEPGTLWLNGASFGSYDLFFRSHVIPEVEMGGVLLNDIDVDGDVLTASLYTDPNNGTVSLNSDGAFVYTPNPDFAGQDAFTYLVDDGSGLTYLGWVRISVASVNDPPVATPDSISVDEDEVLTLDPSAILGNDSDVDGDALTVSLVNDVSHGTLSLSSNGAITYTPDADYSGSDSFTYQVDDGQGGVDTATVAIVVHPVNDAPVAGDDTYEVDEDATLQVDAPGVGTDDTDIENDFLTFALVADVEHGSMTFNTDGTFTYIPDENYNGPDGFTYRVHDGKGGTDIGSVSLTVNAVNDAPTAVDDGFTVEEDGTLDVPATGLLENDLDVELDSLMVALVDDVDHGTLTLNPDGSFNYVPDPDFHGTDTFTYTAVDSEGAVSETATVSLEVTPVNDDPEVEDQAFTIAENSAPGTAVGQVQASDVDGDPLSFAIVDGNNAGAFTISADGQISVDDAAPLDYEQTPEFELTIEVFDGTETVTATIQISLTDVVEDTPGPEIDIEPLDEDNRINLRRDRSTAVVIFGSDTFDTSEIEIDSLRFGATGEEASLEYVSLLWFRWPAVLYLDVNGDGQRDLVAWFETSETGLEAGDTEATLSGTTSNGETFEASQSVEVTSGRRGRGRGR